MNDHFDILETAEACKEPAEAQLDRDVEDIIDGYGAQAFVRSITRCSVSDKIKRIFGPGSNQMRLVVWVLSEIIGSSRARLTAECIALATGMLNEGDLTMTKVAKRHGMTKANVSRRVLQIADKLDMEPSTLMKPKKDRLQYSLTNGTTKHKTKTL